VKKQSLPKDIVDQWPEIFNEIDVKAVPLEYLDSMRIIFKDGKIWLFRLKNKSKTVETDEFKENLETLIDTYRENIEHIDFRLDVDKVKKDIVKKTNNFMKAKKKK
jgi:hypothetical protein